ncbi:cytochrome c [Cytophagaceae bacterium ABcell3]|nr:cytochrome c [Cytophagaceae bacterium ABcell3]
MPHLSGYKLCLILADAKLGCQLFLNNCQSCHSLGSDSGYISLEDTPKEAIVLIIPNINDSNYHKPTYFDLTDCEKAHITEYILSYYNEPFDEPIVEVEKSCSQLGFFPESPSK